MPPITTDPMLLAITALFAYLLGSVPFGIVITRALGLGDLRQIGSGNIGATNVLRTGNKRAALATLLLDAAKGGVAVLVARALVGGEDAAQVAGLAAFVGHLYPVWLRFKGGKGVATFLGTLLALAWPVGLAACATWVVAALITRTSSIAALLAAGLTPIWLIYFNEGWLLALTFVLTVLVYIRHTENLKRIKAGTEPKFGQKKA
ncbi:MAG: glycerol-3-phosphate 1-O-acyltransferase PlsY [Tabrizicola sp.]|uniref:glycerol-3-phosphate 1-O-acyltransferase PlsY n=1 Tax=Tabrizicola sp. TaxID=2005166 RepID=UPI0027376A2A|nr:glycerol-3-phosphate 1-O-acyltransferase PlsY [Tabrizicola sp.]MDP3263537.1 glycerol-3-phosphate 1-O-acyltransferase PlsY [Tabrizicola sp.]MDP3649728.1 glycerol-3-phosphate 1-O-acyltransferase PlsY [Paracoccaceae bacterium]